MIYDIIENLDKHGFSEIKDFLNNNDVFSLEAGKHPINDHLYVFVNKYETNTNKLSFEGHLDYIDIQVLLKGEEYGYVAKKANGKITVEYSKEKDILWADASSYDQLYLKEGSFAVLFPNDLHCFGKCVNNQSSNLKLVFKLKI